MAAATCTLATTVLQVRNDPAALREAAEVAGMGDRSMTEMIEWAEFVIGRIFSDRPAFAD